ncbi:MAG: hypothetical protein AAF549_08910 [Pseudomonadota bacterium]
MKLLLFIFSLLLFNQPSLAQMQEKVSDESSSIELEEGSEELETLEAVPPEFISRTQNPIIEEMLAKAKKSLDIPYPPIMPSLFFNNQELALLDDARLGFDARAATDSELARAQSGRSVRKGPREISLAGIVYSSSNDWAIWLNDQKITPNRIPPEILDIDVSKDSIKIRWYDAFTNQIFPIKLRTYQRFNIDTRIFLPG